MQPNLVDGSDGQTLREIELSLKSDVLIQHVDEGSRLQCVVENAVKSVVHLLLAARDPESRSASEFVQDVFRLRLCVLALDDQFHLCLVLHYWPKTPGVNFVCDEYDSALELVYEFGCDLHTACMKCESIEDPERDDILWETRANGVQALLWKQEALQQVADWAPPPCEVPDCQLVREWDIVEAQFRDELRRANGKVLGLVDDARRGRLRRVMKRLHSHVQTTPTSDSDSRTLRQLRDEWTTDAPWSDCPEDERLRYAVFQVARLCFDLMYVARHPELCLSSEFAESYIAIAAGRCALSDKLLPELEDWPKTPGAAFVKWVEDSALQLIYVLSFDVEEACYRYGFPVITLLDGLPGETYANSPRVAHWKEPALQHIRERLLPPRTEYADWLFWRDAHVLLDQFQDELRRAGGEASDALGHAVGGPRANGRSGSSMPMTDGQKAVWDALHGSCKSAKQLASELNTSDVTVRQHILDLRRAVHEILRRPGRGYWRPDAPPRA